MCGTVDQNRALTVAGPLLADACLEELTAARPVNHRACPLAPPFTSSYLVNSKSGWALFIHSVCLCTCVCVCVYVRVSARVLGRFILLFDLFLRYGLRHMFETEINPDKVMKNCCGIAEDLVWELILFDFVETKSKRRIQCIDAKVSLVILKCSRSITIKAPCKPPTMRQIQSHQMYFYPKVSITGQPLFLLGESDQELL